MKVFWDESAWIIGIDWKEATSSMTDEEFKAKLTLFAGQDEQKKARGILVDVGRFRHRPGPDMPPWQVKNISNRYYVSGVEQFPFLFPEGAQIPPAMNQSSPGESFLSKRSPTENKQWYGWAGRDLVCASELKRQHFTTSRASAPRTRISGLLEASFARRCGSSTFAKAVHVSTEEAQ